MSSSSEPQELGSLPAAGLPGPVYSGPGPPAIPVPCALPSLFPTSGLRLWKLLWVGGELWSTCPRVRWGFLCRGGVGRVDGVPGKGLLGLE